MATGHSCVQMNVQVYQNVGVNNLKNSMKNTKRKVEVGVPLKLKRSGAKLLIHKSKQEHHIWYTKTLAIGNQTNKILVALKARICDKK